VTQRECGNCARLVQDGAELCGTCTSALAVSLHGVPDLLENLFVTYSKQDRLSAGGGHRGKLSEAPLPVRLDVTRVIDALGNEVTTWGRVLVETHRCVVPELIRRSPHNGTRGVVFPAGSPTVDAYCYAAEWLAEHVGQLRRHPAALEAHRGLTATIAAAERAVDRPEVRLFIGACDLCQASLYAKPADRSTRCELCGTAYTDVAERWDRALRRLRGYPATAALIAGSIGELYGVIVNRKRINLWYHRRMIDRVDDDPDTGDPRFRIGEVLDRAAKSHPRKAG
jgi:hypothetical protein